MTMPLPSLRVRSWQSLANQVQRMYQPPDYVTGPTNSHATVRIPTNSNQSAQFKVILFRDNHAWCPYCQKVWLFLEEKCVPYEIRKVTMFCYGQKEPWYKKIVPGGMLPALMLEDCASGKKQVITESDRVLQVLEELFGTIGNATKGKSLFDKEVIKNRQLERKLFSYWCQWLCRPSSSAQSEAHCRRQFQDVCRELEKRMQESPGPYLLDDFGISDTILTPYIERMQSSLFYYKGFDMRAEHPLIDKWFSAMESRECYRGTKSDHHTHVHDLPPQMGGCYHPYGFDFTRAQKHDPDNQVLKCMTLVDQPGIASPTISAGLVPREVDEKSFPEPGTSRLEACFRFLKHKENVAHINPVQGEAFDVAVRAVLTKLLDEHRASCENDGEEGPVETLQSLPPKSALALLYIRDRLSIPRDMSFWAGRRMREALGRIAEDFGDKTDLREYHKDNFPGNERKNRWCIPMEHRTDTDPKRFRSQ